jgi:hypothetical protein
MSRMNTPNGLHSRVKPQSPAQRMKGFPSESDLLSMLEKTYCVKPNSDWVWIAELTSSSGIADLVGAKVQRRPNKCRALSTIRSRWAYLLTLVPLLEPISALEFSRVSGATVAHARTMLASFEAAGLVDFDTTSRSWIKRQPMPRIANEFVAIEAKLDDWRRALYQAVQYQDFAAESWVVLCADGAEEALFNSDVFEMRGVGLGTVDQDGMLEVACSPQRRTPRLLSRFWEANAEFAKRALPLLEETCPQRV